MTTGLGASWRHEWQTTAAAATPTPSPRAAVNIILLLILPLLTAVTVATTYDHVMNAEPPAQKGQRRRPPRDELGHRLVRRP